MRDRWQALDVLFGTFWSVTTGLALSRLLFPGSATVIPEETIWAFVGIQLLVLFSIVYFLAFMRPTADQSFPRPNRVLYSALYLFYMVIVLGFAWSAYQVADELPRQLQYFALIPLAAWAFSVSVLPMWVAQSDSSTLPGR